MLATWIYRSILRPLLFCLDPEEAHELGQKLLPAAGGLSGVIRAACLHGVEDALPLLRTSLAGGAISWPVGLAAGFDKNGCQVEYLGDLGFAFAEIGSVTALATDGNPRPRLFRLPADYAVINRLGLNGQGAEAVARRLQTRTASLPVAVNIAKTNLPGLEGDDAVADILASFRALKGVRPVFVTLNTSCPNTHEGALKETAELERILQAVTAENEGHLPLYLKLSPDLGSELLAAFVAIGRRYSTGFVCGNTTTERQGLSQSDLAQRCGRGGLSGRPLKKRMLEQVAAVHRLKEPGQEIIACGGIESAEDVFSAIACGAQAVELYTALVYQGPYLVLEILCEMARRLQAARLSIDELRGRPDLLGRLS